MKGVQVTAAARLHLGFLDLAGDLGRQFGSIGLAIDAFETCIELREAPSFEVLGEERERGARLALRIAESLGLDTGKKLDHLERNSPARRTRLRELSSRWRSRRRFVGLRRLPLDAREDARLLDRGARSGVGVALFERGGLAVDAGRGSNTEIPPVVAWVNFPRDWRILLILDPRVEGAHGEAETRAFANCRLFPPTRRAKSAVAHSCKSYPAPPKWISRRSARASPGFRKSSAIISPRPRAAVASQRPGQQGRRAIEGSRGAWNWPELLGTDRLRLCIRPRSCGISRSTRRAEREPGVEIRICGARDHGAEICEEEDVSVR